MGFHLFVLFNAHCALCFYFTMHLPLCMCLLHMDDGTIAVYKQLHAINMTHRCLFVSFIHVFAEALSLFLSLSVHQVITC